MKTGYIDKRAVKADIARLTAEREELKKRTATMRVQIWRLKKLLEQADAINKP